MAKLQELALLIESKIDGVVEVIFQDGMAEYRDEIFVRGEGFHFNVINCGCESMDHHWVCTKDLSEALASVKKAVDEKWFVRKVDYSNMI